MIETNNGKIFKKKSPAVKQSYSLTANKTKGRIIKE